MTKLIANERFFYNGHGVEVGEEFQALTKDVPLLTSALSPRARRAPSVQAPAMVPGSEPPVGEQKPDKPSNRHRRRDMLAEA